jgi:hypothetical protein
MAQLVEQLTLNQRVPGSSPGGRTTRSPAAGQRQDRRSRVSLPKWRNWQTRWTQNPVWLTPGEGSTPSFGTDAVVFVHGLCFAFPAGREAVCRDDACLEERLQAHQGDEILPQDIVGRLR